MIFFESCCIFLHGFYLLFLAFVYLFFSNLKSITPFFCTINNNFSYQCPIKCYFIFSIFFIMLRIGSSQPEVFRKRLLRDSNMVLKEILWRAIVIFFSFFIIIIINFFENLAKFSDNPFWVICDIEDAYFVKKLLMVASEILTYSEIYNPL